MEIISQLAAVVAVLALAAGAAWLLRRAGMVRLRGSRRTGLIEVIESKPVTPQLSIHVLKIKGVETVLAVHSSGVTVLEQKAEAFKAVGR